MKRNNVVFITGSDEVQILTDRILKKVNRRLVDSHSPYSARCIEATAIPKKWGGYEIPLSLHKLTNKDVKQCKRELFDKMGNNELDTLVLHLMKDTRKHGDVEFGVALIGRCKKSKGPGILFFWER